MKKVFMLLSLSITSTAVMPSVGSAKLVLDLPPILAGKTSQQNCTDSTDCSGSTPNCCNGTCQTATCPTVCTDSTDCSGSTPNCCNGTCQTATCPVVCTDSTACSVSTPNCCNGTCQTAACIPAAGGLNDTGITSKVGTGLQDADFGRDANNTTNSDTDGWKGFSFTNTPSGGCITDKTTRLTWSPDLGTSNWDGTGAVVTANSNLCGKTGWRLPTLRELLSIVSYHRTAPAIDNDAARGFFSDTQNASYWTTDPVSSAATQWGVNFSTGGTAFLDTATLQSARVRLVTKN